MTDMWQFFSIDAISFLIIYNSDIHSIHMSVLELSTCKRG